jgi:hypothetical protein
MKLMSKTLHRLHEGYLSDAPGRSESWTEFVRYLGFARWEIVSKGTVFSGNAPAETMTQRLGTKATIMWMLDRDNEDRDLPKDLRGTQEDDDETRALGPRGARLLKIAKKEQATYCVACLQGWIAGTWPPEKKLPPVRVLAVNGVTTRGVWIRVHHVVYDVETSLGPGYLYPPGPDNMANLVLKSASSMSQSSTRSVRISRQMIQDLQQFKAEFAALKTK